MSPQDLFITATGTDRGKSVISALLLGFLVKEGKSAMLMKPAQSGVLSREEDELKAARALLSNLWSPELEENAAPYTLKEPLSPDFAARRQGIRIEEERLDRARAFLKSRFERLLIEGAGGVRVPLNESLEVIDLMSRWGSKALVVSLPSLGSVNETLLTLEALKRRNIETLGFVFNSPKPETDPLIEAIVEDNRKTIERRGGLPCLGRVPFLGAVPLEAKALWSLAKTHLSPRLLEAL